MLPALVDKVTSDKYTPLPESTGVDRCRSRPGVPELAGKVTRDDVARLAGVSTATVSYVINNGPRPVARDKQKSVQEAIRKLGYEPDGVARSLVTKRTRTIGFIVPDILNPAHTAITCALGDALWAQITASRWATAMKTRSASWLTCALSAARAWTALR